MTFIEHYCQDYRCSKMLIIWIQEQRSIAKLPVFQSISIDWSIHHPSTHLHRSHCWYIYRSQTIFPVFLIIISASWVRGDQHSNVTQKSDNHFFYSNFKAVNFKLNVILVDPCREKYRETGRTKFFSPLLACWSPRGILEVSLIITKLHVFCRTSNGGSVI